MIDAIIDNIWDEPCNAICITTNGFVKNNGDLVMGAGIAGQAQIRWPWLPSEFGEIVTKYGNNVSAVKLLDTGLYLIGYPVKHNWWEEADPELIKRSAEQLMDLLDAMGADDNFKVLLPRPGCGNGRLKWDDVKPIIEPILDDRVWVVTNKL